MAILASIVSLDPVHKLLGQTKAEQKTPTVPCSTSSLAPPSSFNAVPVEILLEIFELCQSNGAQDDPLVPALLHISSVCKQWRAVAMAAPHLWARIALWNPQEMHEAIAQQWLYRSQRCPLTLIIRHSASEPLAGWKTVANATGRIFDLLLQHTRRWRSLTLSVTKITTPSSIPSDTEASVLEHLDITDRELHFHASTFSFWESVLSQSPLRRVRWYCTKPDWVRRVPNMVNCHWERLTHVSGQFVVVDDFMDALRQCQALEVLELLKLTASDGSPVPCVSRILPHLHTLRIRCRDRSATQLARQLVVPNLRRLDIELVEGCLAAWVDLFEFSCCTLDTARVWIQEPTPENDILRFISSPSVSSLTELEVALHPISDFIVKALTVQGNRMSMQLPSLQRLLLWLTQCSDGLLTEMVKSRISYPNSMLTHVFINNFTGELKDKPSNDACFFQQLRSSGFDINYLGE